MKQKPKVKPITHQVRETALKLLKKHPEGIAWSKLNQLIEEAHPDFHPKTINGVTWRLCETNPEVHKPKRGLFKLRVQERQ